MSGAAQTDDSTLTLTRRDPTMDLQTITDLTVAIAQKQAEIAANPSGSQVQGGWDVVAGLHPTISDFNELLKGGDVIDLVMWRFIQHLGDIRNLCDHGKDREPTKDEVLELIDGVDKVIKTVF
jgi:hypothetical protein